MAGDRYKKRQKNMKRKALKEKEEWSDSDSEQGKPVKWVKKACPIKQQQTGKSDANKAVRACLDVASVLHEASKQRFSLVIPGSSQPAILLYSSQQHQDTATTMQLDTAEQSQLDTDTAIQSLKDIVAQSQLTTASATQSQEDGSTQLKLSSLQPQLDFWHTEVRRPFLFLHIYLTHPCPGACQCPWPWPGKAAS